MGRDDDAIGRRLERRECIASRVDRVRLDHHSVRRDPGLVQRLESAVEAPSGGGASGVLVHDVAARRGAYRREHRDEVLAAAGSALHRVQQLLAGHGLVRDHEDVAHTFTSSSSTTRSSLKTACRAPGTPYSYGPPTTCGISSKLKTGGGDETCHSSVGARHGFADAGAPRAQETIML